MELLADLILKKYHSSKGWQVSIILVNDEQMTRLNRTYFNKIMPTDVISFNMDDNDHPSFLQGEIYIDVDQASLQARRYGASLQNEILRLTAHGIFHLLGYTDETEESSLMMTKLEDEMLTEFEQFGRN